MLCCVGDDEYKVLFYFYFYFFNIFYIIPRCQIFIEDHRFDSRDKAGGGGGREDADINVLLVDSTRNLSRDPVKSL